MENRPSQWIKKEDKLEINAMKKIKQGDLIKSERGYNWPFGLYYCDDFAEEVGVDDYDLGRVFNKCFSKCDGPEG